MTNGIGPRLLSTHRVSRQSLTPSLSQSEPATSRWQFEVNDTPPVRPFRAAVRRRMAPRLN